MLLVVAKSSGSSPGRQGYKMAVASDGDLFGSIGGGVMEVNLVEESRRLLSVPPSVAGRFREQVHRENSPHASGMICSGKQTVIFFLLSAEHSRAVSAIIESLGRKDSITVEIFREAFKVVAENPPATADGTDPATAESSSAANAGGTNFVANETSFRYTEQLGLKDDLYIIGGGHCALALSELMSKMEFHITLFDDRPELNTIEKNRYAHDIKIVDSYDRIGDYVSSGQRAFVVVMTLGYKTDELVIRSLIDGEYKYFGVLGSKAKMSSLFKALKDDGIPEVKLNRIRTPIGLPINSRTPEEIAVSIAAEIIAVKNG